MQLQDHIHIVSVDDHPIEHLRVLSERLLEKCRKGRTAIVEICAQGDVTNQTADDEA